MPVMHMLQWYTMDVEFEKNIVLQAGEIKLRIAEVVYGRCRYKLCTILIIRSSC